MILNHAIDLMGYTYRLLEMVDYSTFTSIIILVLSFAFIGKEIEDFNILHINWREFYWKTC